MRQMTDSCRRTNKEKGQNAGKHADLNDEHERKKNSEGQHVISLEWNKRIDESKRVVNKRLLGSNTAVTMVLRKRGGYD